MEPWQDRTGHAKHLGTIWKLTKRSHTATCELYGHPFGSEAVVLVDRDIKESRVFKDSKAMVDITWEWRKAFEAKGWR